MALFICIYMLTNSQVFPRNCQFESSKYKEILKEYLRTILGFYLMFGVNSNRCITHFVSRQAGCSYKTANYLVVSFKK